ncbi:MAG: DUF5671 domain-containing protein [Minisyncoccia bacterium]
MNPQSKNNAKDFFLNLGATVALYTTVGSLINLLFSVINSAYPQITNGYDYYGSQSISWPVAILVIFFPIFILLMWIIAKDYVANPERRGTGIHKWLTYITLFIAGLAMAGDLITILYYFIDGQELTTGFLLKIFVLLVIAGSVFAYYISDIRNKLNEKSRMMWRSFALAIVLGSIVWGFSVLGSPRTQRLYKYDEQKINDLTNINSQIEMYYTTKGVLPNSLNDVAGVSYSIIPVDLQTTKSYQYEKTGNTTYKLCAEFNKATPDATQPNIYARPIGYVSWAHPVGNYCFELTINPNMYSKPVPIR